MPSPSISKQTRLAPADLRWHCPLDIIPAETTEGVEPIEGIIGQDRALKALKMGVELNAPGYNIFICGLSGTGKATTIKTILEKIQAFGSLPHDYCYVHNFSDPDRPLLLAFPRGEGTIFRADMKETVSILRTRIPRIFEEEEFLRKRQSIIDEFGKKESELFAQFEETIIPDGFVLGRIQEGQAAHPELFVKEGEKTVLVADIPGLVQSGELTEERANEILEKFKTHRATLQDVFRQGIQLSREYQKLVADHEKEVVSMVVEATFAELLEKHTDPKVREYLGQVVIDVLDSLERFKGKRTEGGEDADEDPFTEYAVNLVLDNKDTLACPVIIETAPTYTNLFGTIERQQDTNGFWYTDFTRIKGGSLLRADGGFLVLNAADALSEPGVWRSLQRVLLYRKLEFQSTDAMALQAFTILKPEAIDINVKVILIGNNELYGLLTEYERDFKKIFKVKADFDYEMDNTQLAILQYTALIRKLITDENLRHFDKHALSTIVEYGSRLAGSKKKLTTQFSEIADIVREADYWCLQNGNKYVMQEHVLKAIDETRDRHALADDKLQEMIEEGVLLIDTEGARTGQINGLAVYAGDRFAFGKPSRITVAVSAGTAGIINIEREARLSGSTYDKGVLILTGYLREHFAQQMPLTLTASISFEQSYSGVDGDSASSTEIYAILSALSGVPIRQSFAVTGSVNQKGDIQAIGGVNEKIEGFFDVCRARGLTGEQGVIIPRQNVDDLMLRQDLVNTVRAGRFHIHAVRRVEEGIELLTGIPAGERGEDGEFPPDTIFGKVEARLHELAEIARKSRKSGKSKA